MQVQIEIQSSNPIVFVYSVKNKWQEEELDSKMNALAQYCMDEDSGEMKT